MDRHTVRLVTRLAADYDRRMSRRKRRLFAGLGRLKEARGDGRVVILEIGSGSGANFRYYPDGARVICVERNALFEAPLRASIARLPAVARGDVKISQFLVACAENMRDVASSSVDAVVSTKVLCSVADVDNCLQEILRVLKPVGSLARVVKLKVHGTDTDTDTDTDFVSRRVRRGRPTAAASAARSARRRPGTFVLRAYFLARMSVGDARVYTCTCTVHDKLSCTHLRNYTIGASLKPVRVSVSVGPMEFKLHGTVHAFGLLSCFSHRKRTGKKCVLRTK